MNLSKRSAEELIVLGAGAICLIGLVPFSMVRFSRGELLIGSIDLFGAMLAVVLMVYVYRTRKYLLAGFLTAVASVSGMTLIVFINGTDDLFFLYPTLMVAYFLVSPKIAMVLTTVVLTALTPTLLELMDQFQYFKFVFSMLGCVLFAYSFATIRNRQRDELLKYSTKDPLTGTGNRRALNDKLKEMVQGYQRNKTDCSLLLLDLDNFKQVNDRNGHALGDEILIQLTRTIQDRIRITDNLYRYGGDEFVVMAANCDLETAMSLAEDLRKLVESDAFMNKFKVSISVGVAQFNEGQSMAQWLLSADQALFSAKRGGRNRTVIGV